MNITFWKFLIRNWEQTYYTELLWIICTLIALIVGIKYYRKEKTYFLLLAYTLSSILITTIGYYIIKYTFSLKGLSSIIYLECANTLFAMVEMTTFKYLFRKLLHSSFMDRVIKILWLLFNILCIFFFWNILGNNLSRIQIVSYSFIINIIEFFILLFLSLLYFRHLFIKDFIQITPLLKSPSFWIISGLFFYCVVSLPVLLVGNKLSINQFTLYLLAGSFHYISISFLFLCITKAFSCKVTLTI